MNTFYIGWIAASAALTAVLITVLRPVAHRIGLVDRPSARKAHLTIVPLVGGIAVFCGYLISTQAFAPQFSPPGIFFAFSAIMLAGGILDDYVNLRPITKLIIQAIAILIMCIAGGTTIQTIGQPIPNFGPIELGFFAIPFTVIVAIGIVNAVNLSDGLDGLAGFQLIVAFGALPFLANRAGADQFVGGLLLLMGCLAAFLAFNSRIFGRKRAEVFLGDAGSMFLGLSYIWFVVELSNGAEAVISPVTGLWLLAVPINDTVTMIIRRLMHGRSPFKADKEHLHHIFLMAGFTVAETVMILTGMAVAAAGVGIAGELLDVSDAVMLGIFVAVTAIYLWIILRAWTVMRFLRRSICRRRSMRDRRTNTERRQSRIDLPSGFDRRSGIDRRHGERRKENQAGSRNANDS